MAVIACASDQLPFGEEVALFAGEIYTNVFQFMNRKVVSPLDQRRWHWELKSTGFADALFYFI